jgi:cytochrome c biogenesis protein CcmG/thiol:disulfide interchange protein DsbE
MQRLMKWMADRRRWSILMGAVLALGAVWIWISAVPVSTTTAGEIPSPRQGFAAPDFTLDLLEGGDVTLSDLRGQVVVVNLWASWCPPCRAEMPAMQRLYEANQGRGLEILAVNTTYQDSMAAAREFVTEHGLTFPMPLDQSGAVARLYQLQALPTTFFIDHEGIIQQVVIGGPISEATLQIAVESLLSEVP